MESKVSLSDFHNGFSVTAEYSYIIAPIGLIPKNEIPPAVGLLEFDFEKFERTRKWQEALKVSKKPKKEYDSRFFSDARNRKGFREDEHAQFCQELLFKVAQENTEEATFWNPFLRNIEDGYTSPIYRGSTFKYNIGDLTPLGVVIDRRIGKNPDVDPNERYMSRSQRETEYYKFVKIGFSKLSSWTLLKEVEASFRQ